MVDPIGLEPTTSAMSRQRSSQLSYGSKLPKINQKNSSIIMIFLILLSIRIYLCLCVSFNLKYSQKK